jgi:uncharacterized protein (UPF0335 family)
MANEQFKFPDEPEEDFKLEIESDDEDLEIEIEDDTPEEDRGKEPLPKDVKEELYNDELEDYSSKVKKKLVQLKKLAHDERREKDAALREQQEAIRMAQQVLDENKRLKSMLHNGERELINTYQVSAEMEVDKAKSNYKEAYESGDPDKLVEAQEELHKAQLKLDRARNFRPTLQEQETPVQNIQPQRQRPQMDDKTAAWVARNKWYVDPKKRGMQEYAKSYHYDLAEQYGQSFVGTDEYYNQIDREMARRFPEEFGAEDVDVKTEARPRTRKATVVAPGTRSSSSKQVKLLKSELNVAKKLGLTPEQYALAKLKMEA